MDGNVFASERRTQCRHAAARSPQFGFPRRALLAVAGAAVLTAGSRQSTSALADESEGSAIRQPTRPDAASFMDRAFEMRRMAVERGDQAYGAVIVLNDRIVGQSWSRVVIDADPTGHAEMSAIRDAARRLNSRSLSGAAMYSSSRPCPMCEAAAYWAGIDELVFGHDLANAGSPKLCR